MLSLYLQIIESEEDKSEFEALYYSYRRLMYYIAIDYLKDKYLAEDAVSETFLKLAQKFKRVQSIGEISSPAVKRYVVVSIKNTALNMVKKKNLHIEEELSDCSIEDISENVIENIIEEEEVNTVLNAISNLPDIYRNVLELYAVCEHDVSDIADVLEISKDAVHKRLQRARAMLKKELRDLK